ncbi:MAG: alanine racemase [Sedimenticola sp.]
MSTYVKPSITKLNSAGQMNKFGASPYYARPIRTEIDGVAIADLTEQFGSPLFVFSERVIRQTIRSLKMAFTSRYPKVTFGWSYKTNYLDAICAIFHQEGSVAEVVSEMEYQKARRLGIPGKNIIFNGPHKSLKILRQAAGEGARIHIDHFDEIDDLEQVAEELDCDVDVAIRINLDAGIQPQWNRFGFNLESGQAMDAVRRLHAGGRLKLQGLHCHIGTFMLEPDAYRIAVEKLVAFGYALEKDYDFKIAYYDLGGGLPSKSRLKGIYFPPEVSIPSLEVYAEKLTDGFYNALRPGDTPELILESGRALIDEAGYLITTVESSKRLPDGRRSYVLDAGVNLLYTSTWYNFTIEMDREVQGMSEAAILNGPLCMNIDVVDEAAMLPPLPRGMHLTLSPVGAYNVTQWMQFIEYRPAVVLISEAGDVDIIREREALEDMVLKERLPQRLKSGLV